MKFITVTLYYTFGCTLLFFCTAFTQPLHMPFYFSDTDPHLIQIGNRSYEIAFHRTNGAIAYIIDQSTGQKVSLGSRHQCLWGATFDSNTINQYRGSCQYQAQENSGASGLFHYTWSPEHSQLTLLYTPHPDELRPITATVVVKPSLDTWFDIQLQIENQGGRVIDRVYFPSELLFATKEIEEALLPFRPGVALQKGFFQEGRAYGAHYPAPMFADYMHLSSQGGRFTLYALHGSPTLFAEEATTPQTTISQTMGEHIPPVYLGFDHAEQEGQRQTFYRHTFFTDIRHTQRWHSPVMRFHISQPLAESIHHFRRDNGLDQFPSLGTKLGPRYERLSQSPLLKADMGDLWREYNVRFTDYAQQIFPRLPKPALLHPVTFWSGGFDENYPDFLNLDSELGTVEELASLFQKAQATEMLVMPYINPTFWDDESLTLRNLPDVLTLEDVVVSDHRGEPVYEFYGKHGGYVVSPHAPFVQRHVQKTFHDFTQIIPSDLILEDQIGSRSPVQDYSPATLSPVTYADGWLAHTRKYQHLNLMTEDGFDRLAETEIGFNGSVLLAQRDGHTLNWWGLGVEETTSQDEPNWRPYPFAPMLVRDKVFFYQHDLAPHTMTVDKATLTWNMAMGYLLGHDLHTTHFGGGLDSPWLRLVGDFQRHVLALYANEQVRDFIYLAENVTLTRFETYSVIANWDRTQPYVSVRGSLMQHTIPPQGVLAFRHDGKMVAGLFTHYNGDALDGRGANQEHYLIEDRRADTITIRQPLGEDTRLTIHPLPAWDAASVLKVTAYDGSDRVMDQREQRERAFTYRQQINGEAVAYYSVSQ